MALARYGSALAVRTCQEKPMVLLMTVLAAVGLGLAGSRAALWTVLFLMTRRIVRNMNTAIAVDHDTPFGYS
jgi:hypothetical protein